MIRVYIMNTEPLKDNELYERSYSGISYERRDRADRMKQPADKIRSVGASLLLEYALGKMGISNFRYGYGDKGKPFLVDRDDICFNISHSGDRVMCAVSSYPVGCDVERINDVSEALEKKVLTVSEREQCAVSNNRKKMFFRFWTSKESFVKAVGDGMALSLLETEIVWGEGSNRVRAPKFADKEYYVKEYFGDDGYCYACCSADEELPTEPFVLEVEKILEEM
ncbi:MAG: 4'-phosphopantetheinyl transferase superfamily protein [Clostridia bacterium]|nr:4'-phosphopantetheinyl transferase superfamily protein [Clostridia bacterium]